VDGPWWNRRRDPTGYRNGRDWKAHPVIWSCVPSSLGSASEAVSVSRRTETCEVVRSKQGWIYLISDGRAYKIGYARDPEKRLRLLQTGSSESLQIIAVINGPSSLERELHELFAGDRFRGEWFNSSRELLGFFEEHGFLCICRRQVDPDCFIHGEGPAW
jgi:hypothetical protein